MTEEGINAKKKKSEYLKNRVVVTSITGQRVRDYVMLVKLRLSLTVVFSSVMAFVIAANGRVDWVSLVVLAVGGFLVTGAANALNQAVEKDYDKLMKRTADRPVAAGRMSLSEAVLAAGIMALFGITGLAAFNPWTAFLGTVSLMLYAFLYTPLKRIGPIAVLVGAIPGALPALIGSVAAQGTLTGLGWTLFAIQFLWQVPHFWSIGWLGFEDYQKAGYKLFFENHGPTSEITGKQSFLFCLFLLPLSWGLFWLGEAGLASAIGVSALSVVYAALSWSFYKDNNKQASLRLMFFSFMYLPACFILFAIDKL